MALALLIVLLLGGIAGSVWWFKHTQGNLWLRVTESLLPLLAAAALFMLLGRLAMSSSLDWNDAKLAPVVAMTHGYPLFQDPDSGVMTGWLYGPVGAILFLPAALGRDPTTVVMVGVVINMIAYLTPAMWVLALAAGRRAWPVALAAGLLFFWRSCSTEDLARCLLLASPDGPALGLAACAAASIYHRRSLRNMILSAVFAVLCVWTKQNYLPMLGALILYVWLVDGMKKAGIFAALVAAAFLAISLILLAMFGTNMYFHMITLPAGHTARPDAPSKLAVWRDLIGDFFALHGWGLVTLCFALLMYSLVGAAATRGFRAWFAARPWSLLLTICVFMIPGAVLPYIKIGGFANNLACTDYFLVLTGLAALVTLFSTPAADAASAPLLRFVPAALVVLCVYQAIGGFLDRRSGVDQFWHVLSYPYDNTQYTAFQFARTYPQTTYCPWNPLITLLADGKLYHFEWGVLDRVYAKRQPSVKQFTDHLPANLARVVYIREPQSTAAQSALPGFRTRVNWPELPNCPVFIR